MKHTTTKGKNNKESKMTNSNNTKGFTLIDLIMVTIILGILAAVAIPRYMTSVTAAEAAAEDAVISSIRAGLENYATEQLMSSGRRSWTTNPFDALASIHAIIGIILLEHNPVIMLMLVRSAQENQALINFNLETTMI